MRPWTPPPSSSINTSQPRLVLSGCDDPSRAGNGLVWRHLFRRGGRGIPAEGCLRAQYFPGQHSAVRRECFPVRRPQMHEFQASWRNTSHTSHPRVTLPADPSDLGVFSSQEGSSFPLSLKTFIYFSSSLEDILPWPPFFF